MQEQLYRAALPAQTRAVEPEHILDTRLCLGRGRSDSWEGRKGGR